MERLLLFAGVKFELAKEIVGSNREIYRVQPVSLSVKDCDTFFYCRLKPTCDTGEGHPGASKF